MARTGFASLPLHGGKAPAWLFSRMMKLSHEIKLEEWRRRGWWEKTKERVAVLFAEQY